MTSLEPLVDVTAMRVLSRYLVELDFADGCNRKAPAEVIGTCGAVAA